MRDDLKLAAYAIANGFTLGLDRGRTFDAGAFDANGIPHDGLTFQRGPVSVWETARGWRVAELVGDRYSPPRDSEFHGRLLPALKAALAMEIPPAAAITAEHVDALESAVDAADEDLQHWRRNGDTSDAEAQDARAAELTDARGALAILRAQTGKAAQ
jgi:hypothetical protein